MTGEKPAPVPTEHVPQQVLPGYLAAEVEREPITVDTWNRAVSVARQFDAKPPQGVGFRG